MNLELNLTKNQINKKSLFDTADKPELNKYDVRRNRNQQNPNKEDSQYDSYEVSLLFYFSISLNTHRKIMKKDLKRMKG